MRKGFCQKFHIRGVAGVGFAMIMALPGGLAHASSLSPVQLSGLIDKGVFSGIYTSEYKPVSSSFSRDFGDGYKASIDFNISAQSISVSSSDPTHSSTTLPFGSTIFSNAKIGYQIEFLGGDGLVPVYLESKGHRVGLGGSFLDISNDQTDDSLFYVQTPGNTPPFSSSFDTNNTKIFFQANTIYDVTIGANVIGSGTAFIDPIFTIDSDYVKKYSLIASDGINVSAVPLPASAPMFGAALLGLAGLGYAAKRKKAVTAA